MAIARVQHTYNHKSGLPVDSVVNTFYFESQLPNEEVNTTAATLLAGLVLAFYDEPATGAAFSLNDMIGETSMGPARHTIKVYDMGEPEPRAPVYATTTSNGAVNNAVLPMPAEVCLCLSYRAALVSGTNPAHRRGRIFLGPLSAAIAEPDANGHIRPAVSMREAMCLAGRQLSIDADAVTWNWVVRHAPAGNPGAISHAEIEHCWVDDAFDTQRRRGPAPVARTTQNWS